MHPTHGASDFPTLLSAPLIALHGFPILRKKMNATTLPTAPGWREVLPGPYALPNIWHQAVTDLLVLSVNGTNHHGKSTPLLAEETNARLCRVQLRFQSGALSSSTAALESLLKTQAGFLLAWWARAAKRFETSHGVAACRPEAFLWWS